MSVTEAENRLSLAVAKLLRGFVHGDRKDPATATFFATLVMRLERVPSEQVQTAATNGRQLLFNSEWINGLDGDHILALLAHEVMHCSNKHHLRQESREKFAWNIACDLAINNLLVGAQFSLPREALLPASFSLPCGLSAEDYYDKLPRNEEGKPQLQFGHGGLSGVASCGEVFPAAEDEASAAQQEQEWNVALRQAEGLARQKGKLSANLERLVESQASPKVDWQDELRDFVSDHARNDYSWIPPNRRHVASGLYLPSLHSQAIGTILVAIDTSGSIGQKELAQFAAEIESLASAAECQLVLLYHDSEVCHVQHWSPTDGALELQPRGGGGTDHRPVFVWASEQLDEPPACAVFLTDLISCFPERVPEYPCLWIVPNNRTAPFGRTIQVA